LFENRRQDVISLNQSRGVSAKHQLTTQPSQLYVDSGTLTYMNVNRRHRHSRHFSLTFLQAVSQL